MAPLLMALGVFLLAAGVVVAVSLGAMKLPERLLQRKIEHRMADAARRADAGSDEPDGSLVKDQVEGALPAIDRLASQTRYGSAIGMLVEQSGKRIGVSTVLLASIGLGAVVAFGVTFLVRAAWAVFPGFAIGAVVPFLILSRLKAVRLRRFEEQFPEALDTLSRAIKAGHAFTTAVSMVADEAPDPIGPEFRKTFDEQNFGLPVKEALGNLALRVPILDVQFFVTAVLIQRETGGNLSEILDNLAHVVRERFKILRQVRVYTAHGRLTGYVLLGLPAALAVALMFINPEHMNLLFTERMGRLMLLATVVMQTIGYFWIRKIVKIEV
jgi:tight adherence protein B